MMGAGTDGTTISDMDGPQYLFPSVFQIYTANATFK